MTHSTPPPAPSRDAARMTASPGAGQVQHGSAPHGLTLLAEVLLIGAMTTLGALGVVTAFGAIAAGCASLREYLDHDVAPGPRRYVTLLRAAARGPISLLALPALVLLVAADLLAWHAGMPGGRVLGPAALAAGLAAAVVGLRAASSWRPDPGGGHPAAQWRALLPGAAAEAAADLRGSLLLAGALAACAALAFEIPALTLVLPGLLTLAAVAVPGRAR